MFEIVNNRVIPWLVLADGNGQTEKGFKSEWATVKDEILYIGSMGKEWTTARGEFQTYDPMWVKAVNFHGEVSFMCFISRSFRLLINIHVYYFNKCLRVRYYF